LIGDDIKVGSLVAIDVLRTDPEKPSQVSLNKPNPAERAKDATKITDNEKRYIFVAKDMPKDLKIRFPSVEVYVAKHIADVFGMKKGSQVALTPVCSPPRFVTLS
jgi:hypothetical protein